MIRFTGTLALAVGLAFAPGAKAEPPPIKDFTFKRVGVPKAGQTGVKRITVQIDPVEQARELAERRAAAEAARQKAGQAPDDPPAPAQIAADGAPQPPADLTDWYWQAISPSLSQAGAGRFLSALKALDGAPAGRAMSAPRLQDLQRIANDHAVTLLTATVGTDISPALALAVISVESGGQAAATSPKGAGGLMQLMPDTASRFGVTDATDPAQNIRGGVAYLDWLMKEFDSDAVLALAGYNAGEGAVRKYEGVPPFAETRAYVPKVLAAWRVARGLCQTPPELPSDGCVFVVQRKSTNG